ncbi:MAG: hypothetical protein IJS14_13730 [Lentisphaeria bacterium]|nr:hypothetical protein [Lentisphaeria bacterium]
MKQTRSGSRKKSLLVTIIAGVLLAFPAFAGNEKSVPDSIKETLQERVMLLSQLVADYEKQYKNGSLDGNLLTEARTELYAARILLMKAEQGRAAVPGLAVAILRDLVAQRKLKEFEKRFSHGTLGLSNLLKAKLAANGARLKYLQALQPGKYHEDRLRRLLPELAKADPSNLDDKFLQALVGIEKD